MSRIPENLLWLSRCAKGAARRTGQIFAGVLLDHYSATMQEIRDTGFAAYWAREFRPYLKAAASQFSPRKGNIHRTTHRTAAGQATTDADVIKS